MSNLVSLVGILPAIITGGAAAYMGISHQENWGWFLLATVVLTIASTGGRA